MKRPKRFAKQVYLRLSDDGTGFTYTVTYGCFRLPGRQVQVSEKPENLQDEMPLTRQFGSSPGAKHQDQ